MKKDGPDLNSLQRRLGHVFQDPALLECALTHASYLQDHPEAGPSNQRLEFLGDAVLQLVLSEALFQDYPVDREGALSKRRSTLSQGRFLSRLAHDLDLAGFLRLGQSEEQTGGRQRASILEDTLEAVVGAIHLDGGYATVRQVVLGWYGSLPGRLARTLGADNPKGLLQELVQGEHGNQALRYAVVRATGEPHQREYEVGVYLLDRFLGSGRGSSKKLAEEAAARAALETLKGQGG